MHKLANHDPNYGDNIACDGCGDIFDARNAIHDVIAYSGADHWVCAMCLDLPEDDLKELLTNYD